MTKDELSYARSKAIFCADNLHLAYFAGQQWHWEGEARRCLEELADAMGYTLAPKGKPAPVPDFPVVIHSQEVTA